VEADLERFLVIFFIVGARGARSGGRSQGFLAFTRRPRTQNPEKGRDPPGIYVYIRIFLKKNLPRVQRSLDARALKPREKLRSSRYLSVFFFEQKFPRLWHLLAKTQRRVENLQVYIFMFFFYFILFRFWHLLADVAVAGGPQGTR
jgi:hypothetical protein